MKRRRRFHPVPAGLTLAGLVVAATATAGLAALPSAAAGQEVSLATVDSLARLGRTDEARDILGRWTSAVEGNAPRLDLQRSLWLRAVLTVDPEQAAFDLRRLVVEYPGGGWSDQALLRLGQLAVARDEPAVAASHFRALLRDYPTSPARLTARAWLEENTDRVARAESDAATEAAARAEAAVRPIPEEPPVPAEETVPDEVAPERPAPAEVEAAVVPEAADPAEIVQEAATPEAESRPISRDVVARGGDALPVPPPAGAEEEAVADTASPEPPPPDTLGRERLAQGRGAPEPVPSEPAPAEPVSPESAATPAPEPAPEEAAEAPTASATPTAEAPESAPPAEPAGDFTVQVGAFASEQRARQLMADVAAAGFEPRLVAMPESALLRVRVGRYADPEAATRAYDRITARGFEAAVVADAAREIPPGGETPQ